MKTAEIIREIMEKDGVSQVELAKKMGYASQGSISNALGRKNGIRTDLFVKMMNKMGFEVIVRRGKDEYVVSEQ